MRKLVVIATLLLWASPARALPIVASNLDVVVLGAQIASSTNPINTAAPPPLFMGILDSRVFFDGSVYTYVNSVLPTGNDNSHFNTAFTVNGFTGAAGFSFADTFSAGGTGTQADFFTADVNGRLHWLGLDRGIGSNWDAGDAIRFYFRSTAPPRFGDYNLLNGEAGTAEGFAPVPEPGTLALLGSGLAALYARRRRVRGRVGSA